MSHGRWKTKRRQRGRFREGKGQERSFEGKGRSPVQMWAEGLHQDGGRGVGEGWGGDHDYSLLVISKTRRIEEKAEEGIKGR